MRIDESDLLIDLYRGATADAPWHRLLLRLTADLQAQMAAIILLPDTPSPDVTARGGFQIFAQIPNPALPFDGEQLLRLRYQRVYAAEELIGARGVNFARIIRIRMDGGGDAWLYFGRDSADFSAAVGARMQSIGPHLGVAAAAFLHHARMRDAAEMTDNLTARVGVGWLTLNAQAVILTASPIPFLAMLEPVFGSIGARMHLDGAAGKTILQTLAAYAGGVHGNAVALRFRRYEMLIRPHFGADTTGQNPVAAVHIRAPVAQAAAPIRALAEMVNITPSEARFALKLSDGLTIAQAADDLGLTIETARNYSKKIYAKMGLRGQSDLIQFLDNSVIRLI